MHGHQEPAQLSERVPHGAVEAGVVGDLDLRIGAEFGEIVRIGEPVDRPGVVGFEHRMGETLEGCSAKVVFLVQDEFEIPGQRGLDRGAAEFAVALRRMGIADREVRAGHGDWIIHPRALAHPPVVDIAAGITRRDRRQPHGAEMQPRRHPDAGQDVFPLADGGVVDPHAGIVDGGMNDAVRIGLRRPDVVVDGFRIRLARSVEFENGDDLARLRLLDQVVIVKTPIRRGVGTETAAGVAGVAARPRPHVEDAHFQDIAGLGVFDCDRSGQQMNADPLTRSANERAFGRAGATAGHRLVFAGPVKHAFRAGIISDHALVIIIGVVGQRFDRRAVPRAKR